MVVQARKSKKKGISQGAVVDLLADEFELLLETLIKIQKLSHNSELILQCLPFFYRKLIDRFQSYKETNADKSAD